MLVLSRNRMHIFVTTKNQFLHTLTQLLVQPVVKNSTRISALAKSRAKSLKVVLNCGDMHFEEEKLIVEDAEVK